MTRFKERQQQKVYDLLIRNPPELPASGGVHGGCTLSSAFNAGRRGVRGVHHGVVGSLQRAAWTAGRDYQKTLAKGGRP